MPYTPPSQASPASSSPQSPVLTRNHSYEGKPQQTLRPGLPRSRSATYIHKHRRSPSLLDNQQPNHALAPVNGNGISRHDHAHRKHGSAGRKHGESEHFANGVAQHPVRPHIDLMIPSDSPASLQTDSVNGSIEDDEEDRGRQIEHLAEQLRGTRIRKQTHSPERTEDSMPAAPKSTPATLTAPSMSPALTPEARKMAHSRSISELHLSQYAATFESPSPGQGTSDSEEGYDDELRIKPQLIRKKSGELVRPALRSAGRRPSSMPGTPTYSKAVHFNEDMEQVRHFLQVDKPIAVSAGSSPVETYDSESEYPFEPPRRPQVTWEIRTSNFPADSPERQRLPVRVERIFLSADSKTLIGTVACANIAFQKLVVARFTLDYWKTTSEVVAEYNNDLRKKQANDGYDRFNFNIKLADQAHLESKTLLLCVRYNVNGQEFWDNNNSMNFQVDFIKKGVPRNAKVGMQGWGAVGSFGAIPRSRQAAPPARPRTFPSVGDDDFAENLEFGTGGLIMRNPRPRANFRNGTTAADQTRSGQHGGQGAFSSRYDFGASLSAALTSAQNDMAKPRRSQPDAPLPPSTITARSSAPAVQPLDGPRPDVISQGRPGKDSPEYTDLLRKFCYYNTPTGGRSHTSPQLERGPPRPSGTVVATAATAVTDSGSDSNPDSSRSSASNSPPSPRPSEIFHQPEAVEAAAASRSTTPPSFPTSPRLTGYRSPSPALSSPYQDYTTHQTLPPQAAQC